MPAAATAATIPIPEPRSQPPGRLRITMRPIPGPYGSVP